MTDFYERLAIVALCIVAAVFALEAEEIARLASAEFIANWWRVK